MPVRPESMPAVLPGREPHAHAAILRMWKARSTTERAGEYAQFVTRKVFPKLRAIEGHRGAYLLRHAAGGAVEVMVLTLWESMAAVRRFAGSEPDKAVVEPEARAVLSSFDDSVTHFEIVHSPETPRE